MSIICMKVREEGKEKKNIKFTHPKMQMKRELLLRVMQQQL